MEKFIAQIYFAGDRSVGINPWSFEMELPESTKDAFNDEPEYREQVRKQIKDLYMDLDVEFTPIVYFSDETL